MSFHFVWRRILQPAAGLPWSLCRGGIGANLEELKAAGVAVREVPGGVEAVMEVPGDVLWCPLVSENVYK